MGVLKRDNGPLGFFLVGLVCLMAGCPYSYQRDGKPDNAEGVEMLMKAKGKTDVFENVPLNTYQENSCSPAVSDPLWHGIIIRAPGKVLFKKGEVVPDETGWYPAFAAIPICGYYSMPVLGDDTVGFLKIVAKDKKTGKVYCGDVYDKDPSPIVPPPESAPVDPKLLEGLFVGGYFNPNLAAFVSLPQESAVYDVHVEFWDHTSNVVTIELEEKK